jgi:hypothetical protein
MMTRSPEERAQLDSHDLRALREQLLAAGVEAGEIEDGTPGSRRKTRVLDPNGYELMIARIEKFGRRRRPPMSPGLV